jgi:hypothetical protein
VEQRFSAAFHFDFMNSALAAAVIVEFTSGAKALRFLPAQLHA